VYSENKDEKKSLVGRSTGDGRECHSENGRNKGRKVKLLKEEESDVASVEEACFSRHTYSRKTVHFADSLILKVGFPNFYPCFFSVKAVHKVMPLP
jgi:hypothetical protein